MINFKKSALVIAHPDDEILWFSSIINKVDKIIIVFNKTNDEKVLHGREKIITKGLLPYKDRIICLNIEEANVFNKSDWKFPKLTSYGVRVNSYKYKNNFNKIKLKLAEELKNYKNIITHNPWGEYGHEEHTQIFKVIEKISYELNFIVWVSGYFSEQSYRIMTLFKNLIDDEFCRLNIDYEFCEKIRNIYIFNKAWTWSKDYEWPQQETFFKLKSNFYNLEVETTKTPKIWSQMNFILMYHVHLTKLSVIRGKIIQFLELIIPNYLFKLLVKIKNKK
jgi:hypothetical protein